MVSNYECQSFLFLCITTCLFCISSLSEIRCRVIYMYPYNVSALAGQYRKHIQEKWCFEQDLNQHSLWLGSQRRHEHSDWQPRHDWEFPVINHCFCLWFLYMESDSNALNYFCMSIYMTYDFLFHWVSLAIRFCDLCVTCMYSIKHIDLLNFSLQKLSDFRSLGSVMNIFACLFLPRSLTK